MSDDEYYDEYDEDIFWIEEPEPDIADDLAATANYDAIFFGDPSLEVEDYYSDWDDLSDDYYDDDPTAVRRQRVMDRQAKKKQSNGEYQKSNGESTKELSSLKPNAAFFQSVIWKNPEHDDRAIKLHEPGDGEKVALLKNWREVFRSSHPAIGRSRMRKERVLGFLNSDASTTPLNTIDSIMEDENREVSADLTSGLSSLETLRESDVDSGNMSNTTPGKSVSPPSMRIDRDLAANTKTANDGHSIEDSGPATRSSRSSASNGTNLNKLPKTSAPSPAKSRKRKASDSFDEEASENKNTMEDVEKPRSKRIASKKVGQETNSTSTSSAPVRRSTRQGKK
ncbi:hypothetical protein ASPWEDRAFT_167662 [Aspergillus wentii DTO 134E9]|uniref:Uncharacterized protein n=1 Tax=Aspergillus wentii DTO 134E9 TaxID=1073089 RepID=A0A1L9S3B3_ASPWE|nr:uncharacterized protein ASPWEDRAFT_167662 [Aspergillus wentii DTO 134E9]KAI9929997.1 hypothetical protein MW887_011807 [Aspergillus wentii]OJJ41652.1 hypothetical protein ASPWEDRAFT_167662 [Aspergillus wentii DTO 134E9]